MTKSSQVRSFASDAIRSTHIVERGDALWEIARAYGMTVESLRENNDLTSDRIYPGQELRLDKKEAEHFQFYTVKEGTILVESLGSIR